MLTLLRTAAASVLAASYLARNESRTLVMVGAGQLAPFVVRAYAARFRLDSVLIWGRTRPRAEALAKRLRDGGIPARYTEELRPSVAAADIVSCATLSPDPIVRGAWLTPGTHLDLIGGFTPAMRETDDDAVRRASLFVDTREGALHEAGDLVQPLQKGLIDESDIQADLFDLTAARHPGRPSDPEITLFKSVGTALEDLAAAGLAFRRLENAS
jgi:ornithine cyclodeaminase